MARPRKEIDKEQFEKLCGLQCTEQEICDWFFITDKTLSAWCKRTYGVGFSEVFRIKRNRGKIALRRKQFKLADSSASMAIWLGKNYLDQTDGQADSGGEINELLRSLHELEEKRKDD
jgi:hypothetical protein